MWQLVTMNKDETRVAKTIVVIRVIYQDWKLGVKPAPVYLRQAFFITNWEGFCYCKSGYKYLKS